MKLTPERARELRKRGIKVDMSQVIREPTPPPVEKPQEKPDEFHKTAMLHLMKLAQANEDNNNKLIALNEVSIKAIEELIKLKSNKGWDCTIGRDGRGQMDSVSIVPK